MSARDTRSWSRRGVLHAAASLGLPFLPARDMATLAAATAGDWPCFRGPSRNGVLDAKVGLLPGGPRKLWTAQVTPGHASMAVVGGRLYTFGRQADNLACLDARTGRRIWSRTIDTHEGDSTPAVEKGRVYAVAGIAAISAERPNARSAPTVYCCDASTGNILWKRALPESTGDRQYGHAGSPVLTEDLVLVNAGAGAALRKSTGEVAWQHAGFPGLATPVLFPWQGRPCVAFFGGDRLITREARTGRELWHIPWKTALAVNACDPVVFDTRIFLCSDYGLGRALYDFSSGQPKAVWQFGSGRGSPFSSGFMHDGQLYCFAAGSFACLDLRSGEPRWEEDGGVSALLLGDLLVRVREQGEVMFGRLTPARYQHLATADTGMRTLKAVPAYWEGKLYLRSESGQIACFQIAA